MFEVAVGAVPLLQGLFVTDPNVFARLQSFCELVVYEGVDSPDAEFDSGMVGVMLMVGEIMLFIGRACCPNDELLVPIPGLMGAIAGNEELRLKSGVTALFPP
jgi:hypothetical protein